MPFKKIVFLSPLFFPVLSFAICTTPVQFKLISASSTDCQYTCNNGGPCGATFYSDDTTCGGGSNGSAGLFHRGATPTLATSPAPGTTHRLCLDDIGSAHQNKPESHSAQIIIRCNNVTVTSACLALHCADNSGTCDSPGPITFTLAA